MGKNLDAIRRDLQAMLPALRDKYGVGRFWIFGSRVHGEAKVGSDLDVLVEFENRGPTLLGFVELEQEIAKRLGVKVDLVERSALRDDLKSRILQEAVAV